MEDVCISTEDVSISTEKQHVSTEKQNFYGEATVQYMFLWRSGATMISDHM